MYKCIHLLIVATNIYIITVLTTISYYTHTHTHTYTHTHIYIYIYIYNNFNHTLHITTNVYLFKLFIAVHFKETGVSSLKMAKCHNMLELNTIKTHKLWKCALAGVTKVLMYHNARNERYISV